MTDAAMAQLEAHEIVYALAASPNFDEDGICFAAQSSGLYRSEDGGSSWQYAYEALELAEPLVTTEVVLSPDFAQDQTVFAGAPGGTSEPRIV